MGLRHHRRALAATILTAALAAPVLAQAPAAPPGVPEIDLKLFEKGEVDRTKGCSVALWQSNRDPEKDRFAYIFTEALTGRNNARQPARIKVGNQVTSLQRAATGGKTSGYGLAEYQLYKMPGDNQYVVLELKLGEIEGEAVEIESGTMSVIMRGRQVFRASVKGGAGCMTSASPGPDLSLAGIFEKMEVPRASVPRNMLAEAKKRFGCDAPLPAKLTGFQLSEESGLWEIPCFRWPYQTTSVVALVYLTDPAAQHEFLTTTVPKGRDPKGAGILYNATWNQKTRIVTSVAMSRGLGDCGAFERHRVNEEGKFTLLEYRAKDSCDGKETKPEQYPLIYRAR